MPIVEPPVITPPPTRPDRADPSTFDDRADAWTIWERDNQVPEMGAAGAATYANAQEAVLRATQAVAARNEAVPAGAAAVAANQAVQVAAPQVAANAAQVAADRTQVTTMVAGATQIQMGGSTGYPTIGPSMINNFAHAQRLKRSLTFTRATVATYLDQMGRLRTAAANVPVFEYSADRRSLGYRSEPSRINLFTYSEDFTGANWDSGSGLAGYFTSEASAIPTTRGALTARKFVSTATTSQGLFLRKRSMVLATGSTYSTAIDMYVPKQTGVANWGLSIDFNDADTAIADGITVFDQWVRVPVPKALTAARTQVDFNIRINGGSPTTAGVEFHAAQAQIELGSNATSYIPTGAATATRAVDILTLAAASALDALNPREGTFLIDFTLSALPTGAVVPFAYRNAASTESLYVDVGPSRMNVFMTVAGASVGFANMLPAGPVVGTKYRLAVAYSAAGFRASLNGGAVVTVAPSSPLSFTWDRLDIAHLANNNQLNGYVAQFYPFPRVLADSELIAFSRT